MYIYIFVCVSVCVVQFSKSEVGNNSVRTNKLFKFRIFKYYW